MNAALVVQVFNYSVTGGRTATVPVLISTTKPILQNARLIDMRLSIRSSNYVVPSVVSDRLYFAISRAILSHVGESRFGSAADYADQLSRDARSLAARCHHVLAAYGAAEGGHAETHEPSQDLWYLYERLTLDSQRFSRCWGRLLLKPEDLAIYDRVSWVNRLLGAQFSNRVLSGDRGTARAAVMTLVKELTQRQHQRSDFWDLLLRYERLEDRVPGGAIGPTRRFTFTAVEDDGTPLSLVGEGSPLEPPFHTEVDGARKSRIVCHAPYGYGGAVLGVDFYRRGTDERAPFIRIVWTHAANQETCWGEALSIIQAMQLERKDGLVRLMRDRAICQQAVSLSDSCVPFGSLLERSSRGANGISTRQMTVRKRYGDAQGGEARLDTLPRFFDFSVGRVTVFADLDLIEEAEMQFGVALPCECWSPALCCRLAECFSRTSNRRIGDRLGRAIFDVVAVGFGLARAKLEGGNGTERGEER
jgi:hypothetical protein